MKERERAEKKKRGEKVSTQLGENGLFWCIWWITCKKLAKWSMQPFNLFFGQIVGGNMWKESRWWGMMRHKERHCYARMIFRPQQMQKEWRTMKFATMSKDHANLCICVRHEIGTVLSAHHWPFANYIRVRIHVHTATLTQMENENEHPTPTNPNTF